MKDIKEQLNILSDVEIFAFDDGVISEKNILANCFEEINLNCYDDYEKCEFFEKNVEIKLDIDDKKYNFSDNSKNSINFCKNDISYFRYFGKNKYGNICNICLEKYKSNNKNFINNVLEIIINENPKTQIKKFYKFKKSGFIFISVRLGLNNIAEDYHNSIKNYFKIPQNLGIIGGRNYSAHYFIGETENKLIYLDPHISQSSVPALKDLYIDGLNSYEMKYVYDLEIANMAPGFSMGFYFMNLNEYNSLKKSLDIHSDRKYNLFSFNQIDKNYLSKKKSMNNEEIKITETLEDDFTILTIEDESNFYKF